MAESKPHFDAMLARRLKATEADTQSYQNRADLTETVLNESALQAGSPLTPVSATPPVPAATATDLTSEMRDHVPPLSPPSTRARGLSHGRPAPNRGGSSSGRGGSSSSSSTKATQEVRRSQRQSDRQLTNTTPSDASSSASRPNTSKPKKSKRTTRADDELEPLPLRLQDTLP